MATAERLPAPSALRRARLPAWLLPADWPRDAAGPALADITVADGRVAALTASKVQATVGESDFDLDGAPVLPTLVDAHTHLDCTFTRSRIRDPKPGLLAGIEAKAADRVNWTAEDLRARAERALEWAVEAGTTLLRTHVDWPRVDAAPTAWRVFGELAVQWKDRIRLQRVGLVHPRLHPDRASAQRLARDVALAGDGAMLGGFIHTSNWNPEAIRHLVVAAAEQGVDLDLHVDEELDPAAQGLGFVAKLLRELRFPGRVVCGHNCALAAQPDDTALATLDAVAEAPITLVSLPQNNLLLQDAAPGRTPRHRGITLIKEARERGVPLLVASDSVQDPFCAVGSFDPCEALMAGLLAGQLDNAFDRYSDTICRADWLGAAPAALPLGVGQPCDLVVFPRASASGWPSRVDRRVVLRRGVLQ